MNRSIPLDFLRRSFQETRRIRSKIRDLKRELSYFPDDEEEPEIVIAGFQLETEGIQLLSLPSDREYLEAVLDEHGRYCERLIRERATLRKFIPYSHFVTYHALYRKLEQVMSRLDPTYPDIGQAAPQPETPEK